MYRSNNETAPTATDHQDWMLILPLKYSRRAGVPFCIKGCLIVRRGLPLRASSLSFGCISPSSGGSLEMELLLRSSSARITRRVISWGTCRGCCDYRFATYHGLRYLDVATSKVASLWEDVENPEEACWMQEQLDCERNSYICLCIRLKKVYLGEVYCKRHLLQSFKGMSKTLDGF